MNENEETETAQNDDRDKNLKNMKNPITIDGNLYVNAFPIIDVKEFDVCVRVLSKKLSVVLEFLFDCIYNRILYYAIFVRNS